MNIASNVLTHDNNGNWYTIEAINQYDSRLIIDRLIIDKVITIAATIPTIMIVVAITKVQREKARNVYVLPV